MIKAEAFAGFRFLLFLLNLCLYLVPSLEYDDDFGLADHLDTLNQFSDNEINVLLHLSYYLGILFLVDIVWLFALPFLLE